MKAEFDNYANSYEDLLRDPIRDRFSASGGDYFHRRKVDLLRRFLTTIGRDSSQLSLLDVGCGKGEFLKFSIPFYRRLAGCDPSEGMLDEADSAAVTLRPQRNPDQIPFESNEFDIVTAVCVFHHVPLETRPVLCAEMHRILRPGGIICIIEHNPFNPVTQIIVRRTPVDAEANLLTPNMAKRLARRVGFRLNRTQHFLFLPERLYARAGWMEDALGRVPLGGQYAIFCQKVD